MQNFFSKTQHLRHLKITTCCYSPSIKKSEKVLADLGRVAPRLEDIRLEEDLAVAVQDALEVSHQASLPWTRWNHGAVSSYPIQLTLNYHPFMKIYQQEIR